MIEVFKPSMGKAEIDAVSEVLLSGWIGLGPKTAQFEKLFAEYIGVERAIGVNSATAALDLAVKLLDIHHGDEVIVPTMTFVSTAHAVVYNLAAPIFADCDERTLNFDLDDVKRKITRKTKAIIPVHYGGRPVDMDALKDIAGTIPIIEDAAHACGASYKGRKCGSLGDLGTFSFHAVKNLAMGDGGCITTDNEEWHERAKKLRWLGIDKGTWDRTGLDKSYWWHYFVDEVGLKCHMNDIMASIGLVQLQRLDAMNARRKEIADEYYKGLSDISEIDLPLPDDETYRSSWHIFHIKTQKRDDLSLYLRENGINTGVHYTPIHTYSCYGNRPSLPVSERLSRVILTLPLFPDLTNEQVDKIITTIWNFFGRK